MSEEEYAARLKEGPTRKELAARLAQAQLDFHQCESFLGAASSLIVGALLAVNAPHAAQRPEEMSIGLSVVDDAAHVLRRAVMQYHVACGTVVTNEDVALRRYDQLAQARKDATTGNGDEEEEEE